MTLKYSVWKLILNVPLAPFELIHHYIRYYFNVCTINLKGRIAFCGSSIFARWHFLSSNMSPLPVINCAISGLTTSSLINQCKGLNNASMIVVYCGSNDLMFGSSPEDTAKRMENFIDSHTNVPVVIISSIKSPDRRHFWDKVDQYNMRLREIVAKMPRLRSYVDVNETIQHNLEYFTLDGLHLTWDGMGALGRSIKPRLDELWDELN